MPNTREWTRSEVLVSPSPRGIHQRAVLQLFRLIDPYVRAGAAAVTMFAPADLDLGSGQLVQPDLSSCLFSRAVESHWTGPTLGHLYSSLK